MMARAALERTPTWVIPTLVAATLGLWGVGGMSLWGDEAATVSAISRSTPQLLEMLTVRDISLGAYYLLLQAWTGLAGMSEIALRIPSVVGVAGAAGLVAVLGAKCYSRAAGLATGLIFATFPSIVMVAHDARPYGLVIFFASLSTVALVVATERSRIWWIAYTLTIAALGLFHFLALTLLLAHGAYVFLVHPRLRATWLISAFLGAAPGVSILAVAKTSTNYWDWIPPLRLDKVLDTPATLAGAVSPGWLALGAGLAIFTLPRMRAWPLILGWLVLPPAALAVGSLIVQPMWLDRYLFVSLPALALLAGIGLARSRLIVVGVALIILVGLPDGARLRDASSRWEDYRAAASYISSAFRPGDAIIYSGPDTRLGFDYYLRKGDNQPADILLLHTAIELRDIRTADRPLTGDLAAPHPRIWRVERSPDTTYPLHRAALARFRETSVKSFPGLKITLYERE